MPQEQKKAPIKRKKRRNKSGLRYILLFAFVFLFALWGLSYIVQSFSPDVDVAIGNNEALTLNDNDTEIRTIDERLKWIQMEDELPTVSIKIQKDETKKQASSIQIKKETSLQKKKKEETVINKNEQPKPEIVRQKLDFRLKNVEDTQIAVKETRPETKVSKVYIGQYSSIEEAIKMQNRITTDAPDTTPFIKSINGAYVVQIGSFTDRDKAISLVARMQSKGYNARVVSTGK